MQALGGAYVMRQAEDAPPIILLEVPFDAGRQVVREASGPQWVRGHAPPMEYRLLNPLIWRVPVEEMSGGGEQKPVVEEVRGASAQGRRNV